MKRPGLAPVVAAAILFVVTTLPAAETSAMASEKPREMSPGAMPASRRAEQVLKRYDKNGDGRIDDDERADAQEAMLKERVERMVQRAANTPGGPEAFRARMLEMFDQNKDGRLDDDERAAAEKYARENGFTAMGEMSPELLQRYDKNANGRIDDDERPALQAFLRERMTAAPERTQAVMRTEMRQRFDTDGNGTIDDAEMAAQETVTRQRFASTPALLRRFDKNSNGQLEDEEWSSARSEVQRWLNESGAVDERETLSRVADEVRRRREERERNK